MSIYVRSSNPKKLIHDINEKIENSEINTWSVDNDKELTQQELLDVMIASYRLSPKKMKKPNTLHIVCKECDDFSLNHIIGVD